MPITIPMQSGAQVIAPREMRPLAPIAMRMHETWGVIAALEEEASDAASVHDINSHSFGGSALSNDAEVRADRLGILSQAEDLTRLAPTSPNAWSRLAQAHLGYGSDSEAARCARLALSLIDQTAPDVPALLASVRVLGESGQFAEAEAAAAGVSQSLSGTLVFSCLSASLAASQGEYELALVRMNGLNHPEASALRGYFLLQVGNFAAALHELRYARKFVPDSPALVGNMAYAYAALGSLNKAIKLARQTYLLSPRSDKSALNLANYLLSADRGEEALTHLREYGKKSARPSLNVTYATVNTLLALGRSGEALRELRRVNGVVKFASPVERGELAGNITFLQFITGKLDRASAIREVRAAINVSQMNSLGLACLLADLGSDTGLLVELTGLYENLRVANSEVELLPLQFRLTTLTGDLEGQHRVAQHWTRVAPLSVEPAVSLVLTTGALVGHAEAAAFGLKALQKFPNNRMLRNNTCYELILSNQLSEARKVLSSGLETLADDPYLTATLGLLLLAEMSSHEAADMYKRAIATADAVFHEEEQKLNFRRLLAAHIRLVAKDVNVPEWLLQAFPFAGPPPAWRSQPVWLGLQARAKCAGLSL